MTKYSQLEINDLKFIVDENEYNVLKNYSENKIEPINTDFNEKNQFYSLVYGFEISTPTKEPNSVYAINTDYKYAFLSEDKIKWLKLINIEFGTLLDVDGLIKQPFAALVLFDDVPNITRSKSLTVFALVKIPLGDKDKYKDPHIITSLIYRHSIWSIKAIEKRFKTEQIENWKEFIDVERMYRVASK